MEKGNIDTHFNNAIGHLGSENSTVVLGGVYILHQIAVKNENYTQIVHDLFCNYLRENAEKLYDDIDFEKTPNKCPAVIQVLIDYLFKPYDNIYKNYKPDLSFSTLINCDFSGTFPNNCDFSNAVLMNCNFHNVTLTSCTFDYAVLTECYYSFATLTNCTFDFATLTECDIDDANLTDCDFKCAVLTRCGFWESKLYNCDFRTTDLIDTELSPNESKQSETEAEN